MSAAPKSPTASSVPAAFTKFVFLATAIRSPPTVDKSLRINYLVNSFDAEELRRDAFAKVRQTAIAGKIAVCNFFQ
jgi:hypothetical protein